MLEKAYNETKSIDYMTKMEEIQEKIKSLVIEINPKSKYLKNQINKIQIF